MHGHLGPRQYDPGSWCHERLPVRPGSHRVGRLGRLVRRPARVLHRPHAGDDLALPERPGQVEISGRALNFPANTGIDGATVQLWKVHDVERPADDGRTARADPWTRPATSVRWSVNGQHRYELAGRTRGRRGQRAAAALLLRAVDPRQPPHQVEPVADRVPAVVVDRRRRRRAVAQASSVRRSGGPVTTLSALDDRSYQIETVSDTWGPQGPIDIVRDRHDTVRREHNHDVTSTTPSTRAIPTCSSPASRRSSPASTCGTRRRHPPDGRISLIHDQRNFDEQQIINTPNSVSASDFMTVTFHDWVQDIDTWPECAHAKPSPCR